MLRWMSGHKGHIFFLVTAVFICSLLPLAHRLVYIDDAWKNVPQTYQDEINYLSQIDEVVRGYPWFGNPYFYEHRNDPTPAFFASNWMAAVPQILGIPIETAMLVNFSSWSIVFVLLAYLLFRRFELPSAVAAAGAFFIYVQNYAQIERASVRQIVLPFFILFFLALQRWLRDPSDKRSIALLSLASGASFYIYGFSWQIAVVTLGFTLLYSIMIRSRAAFFSTLTVIGLTFVIALPMLIGTYRSMQLPHYWESMARFGLAHTHLPPAELVYSGSWVFVSLFVFALMWKYIPSLRASATYMRTLWFLALSGLAMPVVQASNIITGKELETGNHVARFVYPWLAIAFVIFVYVLWKHREEVGFKTARWGLWLLVGVLCVVNVHFIQPFVWIPDTKTQTLWKNQQEYAAPLAWLDAQSEESFVVWADSHEDFMYYIPVITKHYVLYAEPGTLEFETDEEVYERYLASSYFEDVTTEYLKEDMNWFVGRTRAYHTPQVLARAIKVCRLLPFHNDARCGEIQTPHELIGDAYFEALAERFATDIRPNIMDYLGKYHVAYIMKDRVRDENYRPEELGATLVYEDEHYEIYELAQPSE